MFHDTGVRDIKLQREVKLDEYLKYLLDFCKNMALVTCLEVNSMDWSIKWPQWAAIQRKCRHREQCADCPVKRLGQEMEETEVTVRGDKP